MQHYQGKVSGTPSACCASTSTKSKAKAKSKIGKVWFERDGVISGEIQKYRTWKADAVKKLCETFTKMRHTYENVDDRVKDKLKTEMRIVEIKMKIARLVLATSVKEADINIILEDLSKVLTTSEPSAEGASDKISTATECLNASDGDYGMALKKCLAGFGDIGVSVGSSSVLGLGEGPPLPVVSKLASNRNARQD